jgi:hypothetical protein
MGLAMVWGGLAMGRARVSFGWAAHGLSWSGWPVLAMVLVELIMGWSGLAMAVLAVSRARLAMSWDGFAMGWSALPMDWAGLV